MEGRLLDSGGVDVPLFDGYELPGEQPAQALSAGARLSQRQRAAVAGGVHPLTGAPSRSDLGTCGTCYFRVQVGHRGSVYPKCFWTPSRELAVGQLAAPRATSGARTDVRAWWPACPDYRQRTVGPTSS